MIILFGGPGFKLLRWTEPEKADRSFYEETKEKLSRYPDLKFESEVKFWKLFWPFFISFLVFIGSGIWLFAILHLKMWNNDLFGASLFLVCFSFYPTIYGITKFFYYLSYRSQEKDFHTRFIGAVKHSKDYEDFKHNFYTEKNTSH